MRSDHVIYLPSSQNATYDRGKIRKRSLRDAFILDRKCLETNNLDNRAGSNLENRAGPNATSLLGGVSSVGQANFVESVWGPPSFPVETNNFDSKTGSNLENKTGSNATSLLGGVNSGGQANSLESVWGPGNF